MPHASNSRVSSAGRESRSHVRDEAIARIRDRRTHRHRVPTADACKRKIALRVAVRRGRETLSSARRCPRSISVWSTSGLSVDPGAPGKIRHLRRDHAARSCAPAAPPRRAPPAKRPSSPWPTCPRPPADSQWRGGAAYTQCIPSRPRAINQHAGHIADDYHRADLRPRRPRGSLTSTTG